jgi:hypothetical protein
MGPFETAKQIRLAALLYIRDWGLLQFRTLSQAEISANKVILHNYAMSPLKTLKVLIRPPFHWTSVNVVKDNRDGLGLSVDELNKWVYARRSKPFYLVPISDALESDMVWIDSHGNQPGWRSCQFQRRLRNRPGGDVFATVTETLFCRPEFLRQGTEIIVTKEPISPEVSGLGHLGDRARVAIESKVCLS